MAATAAHAARDIDEQHPADARASVDINSVSGTMNVIGWDKPAVEVTGTVGNDIERVDVTGDNGHISVQVVSRSSRMWNSDSTAHLTVHVPSGAAVSTTLVSADFKVSGLNGDLDLHTVSGDVRGETGGNLRVNTVSGNVEINAKEAKSLAARSVSGDIEISGGSGEADVTTISGTLKVKLGTQNHVHLKSVSGDITASLGLANDAQLEGEAVSGDITLKISGNASADYDVETHSGSISNCFGPKPVEPRYGPGSKLVFKNGDSSARVHVLTHSGDVRVCTQS
jgi:DUF4097 and DUF4098 domain-containing protein YvlB